MAVLSRAKQAVKALHSNGSFALCLLMQKHSSATSLWVYLMLSSPSKVHSSTL